MKGPKARVDDLVIEDVADELVVYDERRQMVHALSAEAAAVWKICDGTLAVPSIGEQLGFEPDVVEHALDELRANDLLEETVAVHHGHTRREATKKLAMAGTAAFMAPYVYSVSIASATTCPCSLNKPGCLPNGTPLTNGTNTCTSGGISGAKGCDCTCCSGVCYEGTGNARFCASATCVAGGTAAPGGDCSKCCSGVCAGGSSTCGSGTPT